MLEQKEDEGDLEPEAWSAGSLTDMRGHCTIPKLRLAAPQPSEEGMLGQFKCFSKLFAVYTKFRRGQASAYQTMLFCNTGYVWLWEKKPKTFPAHTACPQCLQQR